MKVLLFFVVFIFYARAQCSNCFQVTYQYDGLIPPPITCAGEVRGYTAMLVTTCEPLVCSWDSNGFYKRTECVLTMPGPISNNSYTITTAAPSPAVTCDNLLDGIGAVSRTSVIYKKCLVAPHPSPYRARYNCTGSHVEITSANNFVGPTGCGGNFAPGTFHLDKIKTGRYCTTPREAIDTGSCTGSAGSSLSVLFLISVLLPLFI